MTAAEIHELIAYSAWAVVGVIFAYFFIRAAFNDCD